MSIETASQGRTGQFCGCALLLNATLTFAAGYLIGISRIGLPVRSPKRRKPRSYRQRTALHVCLAPIRSDCGLMTPLLDRAKLCLDKLCVDKLCFDKLCFDKLCFDKLCADKLCFDKLCADKLCADKLCVKLYAATRNTVTRNTVSPNFVTLNITALSKYGCRQTGYLVATKQGVNRKAASQLDTVIL